MMTFEEFKKWNQQQLVRYGAKTILGGYEYYVKREEQIAAETQRRIEEQQAYRIKNGRTIRELLTEYLAGDEWLEVTESKEVQQWLDEKYLSLREAQEHDVPDFRIKTATWLCFPLQINSCEDYEDGGCEDTVFIRLMHRSGEQVYTVHI